VVDIGCNEGLITLRVAARFLSASTLGIDIDNGLIKKAVRDLCIAREELGAWATKGKCTPAVVNTWRGGHAEWKPSKGVEALRHVTLRHENFVESEDCVPESQDVIMW
jgi:trans-aconitate methyltransferase